jgi:hypothetical protein
VVVRAGWCLLALILIVSFVILLPGLYTQLSTICAGSRCALVQPNPASAHTLTALGLSVQGYAVLTTGIIALVSLICFTAAGIIFWRRSDDWMALLIALAHVAVGAVLIYYAGETRSSGPRLLAFISAELAVGIELLSGFLFPTGRFILAGTRWVVVGWLVAGVALTAAFPTIGISAFTVQTALTLVAFALLAWSLLAGYRRLRSPVQRAQIRWVAFGGVVAIGIELALFTPTLLVPALGHPGSLYWLASAPISALPLAFYAVCVGVAILRYHLYDIDILINRTLVYGSLTALLALVYAVGVTVLQLVATALTGQPGSQPIVIVASTLIIAALFQPLRRHLQVIIDRRFFRRKYDAARTLESFSASLRSEMDLADLGAQLVAIVEETMQPTQVALWLRPHAREGSLEAARHSDDEGPRA